MKMYISKKVVPGWLSAPIPQVKPTRENQIQLKNCTKHGTNLIKRAGLHSPERYDSMTAYDYKNSIIFIN